MARSMQNFTWAALAASNLTGKLHCFAKGTTADAVDLASAGGEVIGTIIEEATQGNPASIQIDAVAKCILGTTLVAGAAVESDVSGHAVALSSGKKAGILLTGGDSGDVVSILLHA